MELGVRLMFRCFRCLFTLLFSKACVCVSCLKTGERNMVLMSCRSPYAIVPSPSSFYAILTCFERAPQLPPSPHALALLSDCESPSSPITVWKNVYIHRL